MALTGTCVPAIGHKSTFLPLIALFVTAIACGNIKPCLAAFGGDQYNPKDTALIGKFFSMFYMAVNVGATFSMIFTPMLRSEQSFRLSLTTYLITSRSSLFIAWRWKKQFSRIVDFCYSRFVSRSIDNDMFTWPFSWRAMLWWRLLSGYLRCAYSAHYSRHR